MSNGHFCAGFRDRSDFMAIFVPTRAVVTLLSLTIFAGISFPTEAKVPACGPKQEAGGGDHTGPWRRIVLTMPSLSVRPQVEQAAAKRCREYRKKKVCLLSERPGKLEFVCHN